MLGRDADSWREQPTRKTSPTAHARTKSAFGRLPSGARRSSVGLIGLQPRRQPDPLGPIETGTLDLGAAHRRAAGRG